jgi:hypothetical protein
MLYAIGEDGTVKQILSIPRSRRGFFDSKMRNLSQEDYQGIKEALAVRFGNTEVACSSFIPGSDWTDTPYEPIYWACNENTEEAGFLFGLIVWRFVIEHEDSWGFVSAEESFPDRDIKGKVYFRINPPD